jgi:hypothetical protein
MYQIRYNTRLWKHDFQKSIFDEMVSNGIYKFNPEDVIDVVDALLPDIEILKNDIETILEEQAIKPTVEIAAEFPFEETVKLSAEEVKAQMKVDVLIELEYYTERLNTLRNEMEIKLKRLGSNKFANAGKKLRFNLTVEEIGCLFGLLKELNYIISIGENKDYEIKELAIFLSNNFISRNVKSAISISNLEASLQQKNRDSAKISKLLMDLCSI